MDCLEMAGMGATHPVGLLSLVITGTFKEGRVNLSRPAPKDRRGSLNLLLTHLGCLWPGARDQALPIRPSPHISRPLNCSGFSRRESLDGLPGKGVKRGRYQHLLGAWLKGCSTAAGFSIHEVRIQVFTGSDRAVACSGCQHLSTAYGRKRRIVLSRLAEALPGLAWDLDTNIC